MAINWKTFFSFVTEFAPIIIGAVVPGGAAIAVAIGDAINQVEQLYGPGAGSVKKAAVMGIASDAISAVNTAAGKVVLDPTLTTTAVSDGVDLVVSVVNSVVKKQPGA